VSASRRSWSWPGLGKAKRKGRHPQVGVAELLILLTIILLVFGAKRVPQLSRSLGKGIREFREGVAEASREDDDIAELRARKNEEGAKTSPSEADPGGALDAEGDESPAAQKP
jgi:sec-independent protein translocase protein TatA